MDTHNKLNIDTKITGIVGHPIKHTFSPFMHNIAFELLNLNYIYLPFDVPPSNLKSAIKGMVAFNIKGLNITIPHKETILTLVKNQSEEVNIIGAANTIVNDDGLLKAYNTDVQGILETLTPFKEKILNSEVTIFGSGGAARSAIYSLIRNFKPSRINLINRNEERAEALREYFATKMYFNQMKIFGLFKTPIDEVLKNSQLIINATSVGMYPNVNDCIVSNYESFTKGQIVFDIVYNPLKTKLLRLAEAAGAITVDGLTMFVYQGVKSFELWTGVQMPVEKIFKALRLYISPD
jgi:shikimate dehydrogenase